MSDPSARTDEVFLPEQVRRQIARTDELMREVAGGQPPDEDGAGGGSEGDAPLPVVEPGSAPVPGAPEPPPPAPAEPPPAAAPETDQWERRYRTLQGKYDAEIGALRGQVAGMERLLATLQAPPVAPPPPSPGAPPKFNEADVELYGEDMLTAAMRAAEAKFVPVIEELRGQIKQLEGGQQNLQGANLQDRVFNELDKDPELAGHWRALNTDPRFLEWLETTDEYSGLARKIMLGHAYSTGDAIRTGRFFKRFIAEHTVPPPAMPGPQTGAVPARPNGNGAAAAGVRLEDLAAPGRAAGPGAGNGAPSTRIWTRPEITAFYRDRTDGKFRGREAEAQRLETDIFAAASEGRIA